MNLITLVGPTCSGKSELAVELALFLGGVQLDSAGEAGQSKLKQEANFNPQPTKSVIISADSRQVYRYLNLGTGRVAGVWQDSGFEEATFVYRNIPHYLLDYVDPNQRFTLQQYLNDWGELFTTGQLSGAAKPEWVIVCGGTGLYAQSIADEAQIPQYRPECSSAIEQQRDDLQALSVIELQTQLRGYVKLGGEADNLETEKEELRQITFSDWQNSRRLVNLLVKKKAIEEGWLDNTTQLQYPKFSRKFQFCLDRPDLRDILHNRLQVRLNQGLVQETRNLLDNDILSWDRLVDLGLEYRLQQQFFEGLLTFNQLKYSMEQENWKLIKRQRTWFRRWKNLIQVANLDQLVDHLRDAKVI